MTTEDSATASAARQTAAPLPHRTPPDVIDERASKEAKAAMRASTDALRRAAEIAEVRAPEVARRVHELNLSEHLVIALKATLLGVTA